MKRNRGAQPGRKAWNKLAPETELAVKRELEKGTKYETISELLNVHAQTIWRIKKKFSVEVPRLKDPIAISKKADSHYRFSGSSLRIDSFIAKSF